MMFEDIEFVLDWFAEVETTPGRMNQVTFRRGTRLRAQICPLPSAKGSTDLADLRLADGRIARHVPLAQFAVAQQLARAA